MIGWRKIDEHLNLWHTDSSQVGGVDIDLLENQSKDVGTFKKKEGRKREGGEADMADQQKVWAESMV